MKDRYGNEHSTRSIQAFDDYCDGLDRFLAAQPGGIERLQRATLSDPSYAVAQADLARALQISGDTQAARTAMRSAREHLDGLDRREAAHVGIMSQLVEGRSDQAFDSIRAHLKDYPRDVMIIQPCCGVFGLIGFSGKTGREAENAAFMTQYAQYYAGDWWFESQYAFALSEVGQLDKARTLIDQATAAKPDNANAAHHRAHICYEAGEAAAGLTELIEWRRDYDRKGLLHCHLAWHDALWTLAEGNIDRVWEIVQADILPEVSSAPPINVMTDLVAILLRAELAGHPRQERLWQIASDYAATCFPRPGLSFADAHAAIAHAVCGNQQRLQVLQDTPRGSAGDQVAALASVFAAFASADWRDALNLLTGVMAAHERLGGSRAQRDLLELSYAFLLIQLGLSDEASRARQTRRPQASLGVAPLRIHKPG